MDSNRTRLVGDWEKTFWPQISDCNAFENGGWYLVYSDEFEQESLNTTFWYTCEDGWNHIHGNELQYYQENNIEINNGRLFLIAKREPDWYYNVLINDYTFYEYTSGWIQSKANFKYGKFEIRCKIPSGQGLWPAFWLYGNEGEIDVFEFACEDTYEHNMDIHNWPTNGNHTHCHTDWHAQEGFDDNFHTFSLEWDEFKLIFRVDDVIKRVDYKYMDVLAHGLIDCGHFVSGIFTVNPFFPKAPQSIRINLAISNGGYGSPPNSQTVFPAALEIDYIRIYKRINDGDTIYINNFGNSLCSDVYTADNITIASSDTPIVIDNNQYIIVAANNEVVISDNFCVQGNGSFSAFITRNQNMRSDSSELNMLKNKVIKQEQQKSSTTFFSLYPNPCQNYFTISSKYETSLRVEIYNSLGRMVYSANNVMPTSNIDIGSLMNGLYFVKIFSSHNDSETYKLLISR